MYTNNRPVSLLHYIQPEWNDVNGTIWQDDHNNQHQYLLRNNQSQNLYTINYLIFYAIQLETGRAQVNQISLDLRASLSLPTQFLQQLVATGQRLMTQSQQNKLQEILTNEFTHLKPKTFKRGYLLPITKILTTSFKGLPQINHTTVNTSIYYNGLPSVALEIQSKL